MKTSLNFFSVLLMIFVITSFIGKKAKIVHVNESNVFNAVKIVEDTNNTVTDIDGNVYKTVKIGTQIWAENLNVTSYRTGELIKQVTKKGDWKRPYSVQEACWCYYNNDTANGKKYGKLYNWYAIIDHRGLAPKGWHIPNDSEWFVLENYLNATTNGYAGKAMKSTTGWLPKKGKSGNGTNSCGFCGLPGGHRGDLGEFAGMGVSGEWWSSYCDFDFNRYNSEFSRSRELNSAIDDIYNRKGLAQDVMSGDVGARLTGYGLSVRCVKDK